MMRGKGGEGRGDTGTQVKGEQDERAQRWHSGPSDTLTSRWATGVEGRGGRLVSECHPRHKSLTSHKVLICIRRRAHSGPELCSRLPSASITDAGLQRSPDRPSTALVARVWTRRSTSITKQGIFTVLQSKTIFYSIAA